MTGLFDRITVPYLMRLLHTSIASKKVRNDSVEGDEIVCGGGGMA